jgi:hypothetical protein
LYLACRLSIYKLSYLIINWLTFRDGVPYAAKLSASAILCPSTRPSVDETGQGRSFLDLEGGFTSTGTDEFSCSSGPSLLGAGVDWVLGVIFNNLLCKEAWLLGAAERPGRVEDAEPGVGVLEKKP